LARLHRPHLSAGLIQAPVFATALLVATAATDASTHPVAFEEEVAKAAASPALITANRNIGRRWGGCRRAGAKR